MPSETTVAGTEPNTGDSTPVKTAGSSPTTLAKAPAPRRKLVIILSVLVLALAVASTLLFVKYRHAAKSNPATQQQQLTRQLSQLIEMPPGQPVISTVLDKSKLSNKTLASRARNGDLLFIFPQSKRLILYRPSDKKVVDMLNIQP